MTAPALVRVAAAVILRSDGAVLLAQRPEGKAYAGYWEFPGGKLEAGESPREALDRELAEELGIVVERAAPWLVRRFVYPHAHVELHFFRVFAFSGELIGHDGQAFSWQVSGRFTVGPMLPANAPILNALALPPIYGITNFEDVAEMRALERVRGAFEEGLRLVQVREKTWAPERVAAFTTRLLALAQPYDARILLNGTPDEARALRCHGVHWTAARLAAATQRPDGLLCAASCHTAGDIAHAGALGLDFVVLGPVCRTPSHPDAIPLGWPRFAALREAASLPVFALGGLRREDLNGAIDRGAHGIALRSGAWPDHA